MTNWCWMPETRFEAARNLKLPVRWKVSAARKTLQSNRRARRGASITIVGRTNSVTGRFSDALCGCVRGCCAVEVWVKSIGAMIGPADVRRQAKPVLGPRTPIVALRAIRVFNAKHP